MAEPPREQSSDASNGERLRIQVRGLCKVFGARTQQQSHEALEMVRRGEGQSDVAERTGCTVAVHDLDFDVRHRETFVIMGLSGCGKSTVLRCLNRLIEPTAGEVLIDGTKIGELSQDGLRELRRNKVGMVFQHFALLPHRNVLENAAFGLEIRGVPHDQRQAKAREALEMVGLGSDLSSSVAALSGGMQQRVGLARALATGSEILLMDEAFSALDPLIRGEMQDELLELQARMQKTIVFITHDLDEALKLGDRVAIMKAGGIVQIGTPEEILTHPVDDYVRSFVERVDRSRVITAGTIMQQPRVVLGPKAGPQLAARWAEKFGLSILFVVDQQRRLLGAVHINDVYQQRGGNSDAEPWGEALKTELPTASPGTPVEELLDASARSRDPIPVVDDNGTLVGLVTRTAILCSITGDRATGASPDADAADKPEKTDEGDSKDSGTKGLQTR